MPQDPDGKQAETESDLTEKSKWKKNINFFALAFLVTHHLRSC